MIVSMSARPPRKKNQTDAWYRQQDLKNLAFPPAYYWPSWKALTAFSGNPDGINPSDWDQYGEAIVKILWQELRQYPNGRLWVLGHDPNPFGVCVYVKEAGTDKQADEACCIKIIRSNNRYKVVREKFPQGRKALLNDLLQVIPPYATPLPNTAPVYRWPTRSWSITRFQAQEEKFPNESDWKDCGANAIHWLWIELEQLQNVKVFLVKVDLDPLTVIFYATAANGFEKIVAVDRAGGWRMYDYTPYVDATLATQLANPIDRFYIMLPPPVIVEMPEGF